MFILFQYYTCKVKRQTFNIEACKVVKCRYSYYDKPITNQANITLVSC